MLNSDDLIAFEDEMTELFNAGHIKAPLHLAGGNEDELIAIFRNIRPQDWICCSWRSHYHALLKGVPAQQIKDAVLEGRSISLCFPQQRMISSGIVAGNMPVALGLAWSIKRKQLNERVWCFIGDMTARSGLANECMSYASGFHLPVCWVIEDNGLSVCTETQAAWGHSWPLVLGESYNYKLTKPHVGTGKFVKFGDDGPR